MTLRDPRGPNLPPWGAIVRLANYETGTIALLLLDHDDEPVGTASINLPPQLAPLGPRQLWVRDFDDAIGWPQALVRAGWLSLTAQTLELGHNKRVRLATLTPEAWAYYCNQQGYN